MSGWTDERVELLKKLWLDGQSASQIAKQLGGGVTRNAVIGKVHRLGLAGRAAPSRPIKRPAAPAARPRPAVAAPSAPRMVVVAPAPAATPPVSRAVAVAGERGSVGVLGLETRMCRWPIGDPTDADFGFCGKPAAPGMPYCEEHAKIAYQPQLQKKKVAGKEPDWAAAEMRRMRRSLAG